MTQFNQPYLQHYKGKETRHTCPNCGVKQSFTLYFDGNTNEPINPKVGRCNRELKCGYHYTPKQFYKENPDPNNKWKSTTFSQQFSKSVRKNGYSSTNQLSALKENVTFGTIPFSFVEKSASYQSNFIRFLCKFITEEQIKFIGDNYALGATKNKEIIFWQIDINGKVRTGKIMQYNPETGKRIKHCSGAINWVHNILKRTGKLPKEFNLKQCFFGEHLLKIYPKKTVAIVESEKTACVASVFIPELIWISSGSVNGISVDKCKVLIGRNVILFPDLKAFELWSKKAIEIEKQCRCKVKVSNLLERIASEEAKQKGLDIADFIINTQIETQQNFLTKEEPSSSKSFST